MDALVQAYRDRQLILFVGAGVSMNLGLPSWAELIDHIAQKLGYDPDVFRTYGNNRTLAEFYRLQTGNIGPLRSWMDTNWHQSSIDLSSSPIHSLIANADFDLIYTTNYDNWLEYAFDYYEKPYKQVANVHDLTECLDGRTQIIKFHGDFTDDESIVLDESSYFERLQFESPLDIKLRSDVLGRSVLFIGYGIDDINIRYLFYKLSNLWKNSSKAMVQPTSYLAVIRPNPIQEAILNQWNIKVIPPLNDDPGLALEALLTRLHEG